MICSPRPDPETDLYRRLTTSDPLAPADFAEAMLVPLVAYLATRFPRVHEHLRVEAAEDAVLSVIQNPGLYDPGRTSLPKFLRMAATGDLLNALARERRRAARRSAAAPVELAAPDGKEEDEAEGLPSFDHPTVAAAVARFTDPERRALDLMRAGERRTEAFAAALALAHLPAAEQRRAVKRVKDRLVRRLERAARTP